VTNTDFLVASWGEVGEDGIGRLTVSATASNFAGLGSAWLNKETVLEFSERLKAYPLDPAHEPSIWGGYVTEDRSGVQISLRCYPIGVLGQIGVGIELASDIAQVTDPARQSRLQVELLTGYEALRRFSDHLRQLVEGQVNTARLDGERLLDGPR
jgi:hypothetical protein